MKTTFHPSELKSFDGMIAHVLENGSAFVTITNNEQVYVASKLIEGMNVQAGDGLRCWCVPNPPEHAFTAGWKAIRCIVTHRLIEEVPVKAGVIHEEVVINSPEPSLAQVIEGRGLAKAKAPATPLPARSAPQLKDDLLEGEALRVEIDLILDEARVLSVKEVYVRVCQKHPACWKDQKLMARINNQLVVMSDKGEIATAKLYSSTEQSSATAVFYARSVELITMYLKGEMK